MGFREARRSRASLNPKKIETYLHLGLSSYHPISEGESGRWLAWFFFAVSKLEVA
jgi:hypothetical protein